MLQDKDRIFTNLYGKHSPDLEEAKKRGAWHLTREILAQDAEWICDQIKASGLARTRWCRISNGPEVDLHAEGGARTPALPRRKRR